MCTFVFLGLPSKHRALVNELRAIHVSVDLNTNPSVASVFPAKMDVFMVTRGGCSCDLHATRATPDRTDAARARYRRKGWTTAKIERALASRGRRENPLHNAYRNAVARIVEESEFLHLYAHTFSGSVETELVSIGASVEMNVEEYVAAAGTYPMDTLVTIRSREAEQK